MKRNTYTLHVYVDDGILISEILIDHNIVQKKIGYSPEEINTALSSPDPTQGIMVVRINEASSLPVAIEMQQGCSLSDARLLLGRLKPSNDDQRSQLDPIILSLSSNGVFLHVLLFESQENEPQICLIGHTFGADSDGNAYGIGNKHLRIFVCSVDP
ncbi:hypothetical protein L1987_54268 [Smallanthus sonchifolius]|uniref:Uncharacterized protein n=1 Tax=Smallanthus sonchifolius TaxID=185202 RepID=A0ACB9E6A0_9ASTR|nr:hypothetical protein L1987_54268 [Smallanthus sonchifolius]